jgi:hypothetical protein
MLCVHRIGGERGANRRFDPRELRVEHERVQRPVSFDAVLVQKKSSRPAPPRPSSSRALQLERHLGTDRSFEHRRQRGRRRIEIERAAKLEHPHARAQLRARAHLRRGTKPNRDADARVDTRNFDRVSRVVV